MSEKLPSERALTLRYMTLYLIGLVILFAVFWFFYSPRLITKAYRDPLSSTPADYGLTAENEAFPSDGRTLRGWFIRAPRPTDRAIVVCHGWGANKSDILARTHFFSKDGGYNLFYFDFRGHGESDDGPCSLTKFEQGDLRAALKFIREKHPTETKRLALYGMSMGAATCLSVGAEDKSILGVGAESPFALYDDVIIRYGMILYNVPGFPLGYLTRWATQFRLGFNPNDYSPLWVVDKISPRPLLLLQGGADARMPPAETTKLFEKAGEPKELWTVPGADHGHLVDAAPEEYRRRLLAFFEKVFKS